MELSITFRHVPPSDALKRCVELRLERLERYVRPVGPVHAILDVEKHEHSAELVVPLDGNVLVARAVRPDLYEAVDVAAHKALEQARRHRGRLVDHREKEGRALKQLSA